ncbi:hypothetical protein Esti_000601 [Eimeria stiedai]
MPLLPPCCAAFAGAALVLPFGCINAALRRRGPLALHAALRIASRERHTSLGLCGSLRAAKAADPRRLSPPLRGALLASIHNRNGSPSAGAPFPAHPHSSAQVPPPTAADACSCSVSSASKPRSGAPSCTPLYGRSTPSPGLEKRGLPGAPLRTPPFGGAPQQRTFGGRAGGLKRRKQRRDPGVLQQSGRGRRLEFYWPRKQRLLRVPLQQNSRPSLIYDLRFKRFLCRWTSNGQHLFRPFNSRSRTSGRDGGRGVAAAGAAFGHVRAGGPEAARAKALVLLRQLQRQGKLTAELESTRQTKPEINRSGVRGVYFEPEERLWVAVWKEAGIRRFRSFSSIDLGFQAAYQAAVAVRRQQLALNYDRNETVDGERGGELVSNDVRKKKAASLQKAIASHVHSMASSLHRHLAAEKETNRLAAASRAYCTCLLQLVLLWGFADFNGAACTPSGGFSS